MNPVRLATLVLTAVLLAACGNKGPLYVPGDPPPDPKKQGPAPERAP